MNKNKWVIILLAIILLASSAQAGTMSYVDVSCLNSGADVCSSTIYVYYQDGTLAGSLTGINDTISYDETKAINLYLKPASTSLLNNPSFFFEWMLSSYNLLFALLLVMAVIVSFFYIIRRMFLPGGDKIAAPRSPKRRW